MSPRKSVAAVLILIAGVLCGSSVAQDPPEPGQHVHGDSCVVDHQMLVEGIYAAAGAGKADSPLGNGAWEGDVYVLPYTYDGTYDRDDAGAPNVAPRQWVTGSFLNQNPDRFDFVLVFTNFLWDAGEARGLYWSIANDVEGIGVDLFDLSSEFGSEVLEGYIDGMLLSDYRLPDGSLDRQRVKEIINHELGHRWLVHPSVDDGSGPTDDLLGRDGSHWSYLYGVDDFMYGSEWTDNGDGTFTATSVRKRFSELSLYLMGMTPASAVSPFTLLENPDVDVTQIPMLGATVEATARTLSVDDVIRAEGPRFPDELDSQHELRVGMIFLVDPDEPYFAADLTLLEELRGYWQQSFFRHTLGRGVVQVAEQGDLPPGGGSVDLALALEWLHREAQGALWADSATTELRDSAEAIDALGRAGGYFDAVEEAAAALEDTSAGTAGLRYRKLEALSRYSGDAGLVADLADAAEAEQSAGGGWPAYPRYASDVVTTARAVRGLAAAGRAAAGGGWQWLAERQRADGGWGWQPGSPSSVAVTLEVLLAARLVDPLGFGDLAEVQAGLAWLVDQRVDGGFGDLYPNPTETALFLQLVLDLPIDQALVQGAIDFLAAHQGLDGSWQSSSYKTATAIKALAAYLLPDPYVDAAEAFADPDRPFDGDDVRLIAAVRNGGAPLAAGAEYEWQIYNADDTLALVLPGVLPFLDETGFATVDDLLAGGLLPPGDYTARLAIDPRREISQKTRDNDVADVALEVRTHPEGIDLTLADADLVLLPEEVTATPMPVTVQGVVRNFGLTGATSAELVVFDGDPSGDVRLGSVTVDVASLGQTPFSTGVLLMEARSHLLAVVADPDRLLEDADRFNNQASRQMVLRLEPDLEIRAGGVVATPPSVAVGEPMRIDAEVWNGGTTVLSNFQVAFTYELDGSSFLIEQIAVDGPLAPGESVVVGVDWTPNVGGSIPVTVDADPQRVTGDLDPSDNAQTLVLVIAGSPLANLRVTPESFALVDDPPLQGQTAQVTVTLANPSANDAGPFGAELWLDAIDDGVLLAGQAFAGLAAGGTVDLTATWLIADPEDRLVYVLVDRADEVEELDESDNEAFVEPDVQTLPDLAVTGGGIDMTPDFPQVGDAIHVDVRVANQGDQPTPASLLEWVDGAGAVIDSVAVPALDGHTETTLGLDWNPGGAAGDFDLAVRINAAGAFPEGDYANNQASFSVAIQSGELYVSNQIFSPNGDGVRDTTRISFRNGSDTVEIYGPRGDLSRSLEVTGGGEAVVWDGFNDRGNLARDGLYQVRVGALESWVVVDNNLFSVTLELDQVLLTGFISPRIPGFDEERSYFTSMTRSPVVEELYLVERFHAAGTSSSDDEITLQKWSGDAMIAIGDWTVGLPLMSANLRGDTFVAGYVDDGPFALVRYPENTVESLDPPDEYGFDPWLSPDGRWVVWVSSFMDRIYVEDLENPGSPLEFDAGPYSYNDPCGYAIDWTHNRRATVIVAVSYGESYFYDISFAGTDLGEPPSVAVLGTTNYSGCGGGGIPAFTDPDRAPKSAVGGSLYGAPDAATDFDAGQFVWVTGSYYSYDIGAGARGDGARAGKSRDQEFRVVWDDPDTAPADATQVGRSRGQGFRVVWDDPGTAQAGSGEVPGVVPAHAGASGGFQKGGYGGTEINVLVVGLDGELREQGSFEVDSPPWEPPPVTSISNDGFVVAYGESYYGYDAGGSGYDTRGYADSAAAAAAELRFGRDARLLMDDPSVPDRLASLRAADLEKGGGGSDSQMLLDWRTGEERQLPFPLEKAVWSPQDKYLVADLDTAYDLEGLLAYYTPAANLTARLRPRILFGDAGVDLWLLVTDRYLEYYQLEYADLNAPDIVYEPIGLPSNEPLFGESWGTWLPPANGTYRVRLRVRDRAGNEHAVWRRVVWNGDRDIANLYTENRYMSPRTSPGVKDELIFHYTVLRPANVDFAITDEDGNVYRQIPVAADEVGPMTTTWDGNDDAGNPVPDSRYLLTYGAATWPIIVDNTPPEVVLSFSDTLLVVEKPPQTGDPDEDLWVNEIFAAVRDVNLEEWQYQSYGTHAAGEWSTESLGTDPLEYDGDVAWRVLGAHRLVGSERRIVARDLAGNETIATRGHGDERLSFTDSEPACRTAEPPCVYPTRPELAEIGDSGGFLVGEDQVLSPFYDTLLVHSSVRSDLSDLRLEHREISLVGLPSGPWQPGDVEISHDTVSRVFRTLDVSFATPDYPVLVSDTLAAVYWNHPDLPMVPHEVRLRATSDSGQEVISDPVLFQPEVPLLIQYLGVDENGDHFRVTNASAGVVNNIVLASREIDAAGNIQWVVRYPDVPRLLPGDFAEVHTGCALVPFGDRLFRAQGTGSLGEEAVSLTTGITPREGYSELFGGFLPATCAADGSPQTGRGFFGAEDSSPCAPRPGWPGFWVTTGEPAGVEGRVPVDPTGALVERYELVVDGVSRLSVEGPFLSWDYQQFLDLSSLSEGSHSLSERYIYAAGAPGLLGTCPRSFQVRVDRTPAQVQITEPFADAILCPQDMTVDVALDVLEVGRANHRIFLGDGSVAGDHACGPFTNTTTFEIPSTSLTPGPFDLSARLVDEAGNASCTSIPVIVPDLPNVQLMLDPPIFSPVNALGLPVVEEIRFITGTPGTYDVQVTDTGGDPMAIFSSDFTDGEEELAFAWDGTDLGGLIADDGVYRAVVRAVSPCGAEQTVNKPFELDKTPPAVSLTRPPTGTLVGSSLEFFGSVTDRNFGSYSLEALWLDGAGDWQPVAVGRGGQVPGPDQSLGTWNTESHPPGEYLIRVYARDVPGNEAWTSEVQVTLRPRNFIRRFVREPEIFSPNLDGILDQLEIEYELIQDALVTLTVVDGAGDVAATLQAGELQPGTDPGDGIIVVWDGTLDSGAPAPDGEYELVILAEDPLMPPTLDSEEERLSATVDTVPPDVEFVSPLAGSLSGLPLQVVGSLDELHPDTWELSLQSPDLADEPIGAGTGVFESRVLTELTGRPDGEYLAIFSAVDKAGNRGQTSVAFTIDNTAPAVQIFEPEGGVVINTTANYLRLEGEVIEDNLTSWAWSYAPGTTPAPGDFMTLAEETVLPSGGLVSFDWDASGLDDGPYTLRLSATDEPGRTAEARRTFTVDNTPPEVEISAPASGTVVAGDTDVLGSVDDANLTSWSLTLTSGGSTLPAIATGTEGVAGILLTWTALPADGTYDLTLEAEDAAGNRSDTAISVIVSVTPPEPPILLSAEPAGRDVSLVWQPGAGPAPSGYVVYRDGEPIGPPVPETTLVDPGLGDGSYVYTVTALIPNGTESDPSNALTAVIDFDLPIAHISVPADGARVSDLVQIYGTAHRDTGLAVWRLWVRPVGGLWVPLNSGSASVLADVLGQWDTALPQFPDGFYELKLEVDDVYGNRATAQIQVAADNEPPVAPVLTVAFATILGGDGVTDDIHVEWQLDPVPPDLAGYYLYRNGLLANAPGPVVGSQVPFLLDATTYDDQDLPDGTYIYYVTAADTAENESARSNESDPITIDTRRPHAIIVDPPDGTEFEESVLLTAETPDLDVESVQFEFQADGAATWETLGPPLTRRPYVMDFAPGASGLYHLRAVASDALGPDPAPESISLTEIDLAPPSPAQLDVRVDGGDVELTWTSVPDVHDDLAGYLVYRGGDLLTPAPLPLDQLSYDDLGLVDGYYSYRVTAVDLGDNESVSSPWRSGVVVTPTFYFTGPITETAVAVLSGFVEEYFDAVELERRTAPDTWESLASFGSASPDVSFPAIGLTQGFNVLRFRGEDSSGNRSRWSRELVLVSHPRPSPPADLTAVAAGADVTVDWTESGEPVSAGYVVGRDGTPLGDPPAAFPYDAAGGHQLSGSGGDAADWLRVVDSDPGTSWVPDPATVDAGVVWEWTWPEPRLITEMNLLWGSYARRFSVEVRIDGHWLWWYYRSFTSSSNFYVGLGLEIDGVRVSAAPGSYYCPSCSLAEVSLEGVDLLTPPQLDPGVAAGAHEYLALEINRFGQFSDPSRAIALVATDPPAEPSALTAAAEGCGDVRLEWLAPAPLPAVFLGYRIYRSADGTLFEPIADAAPADLAYLDSGLGIDATFHYRLTALAQITGLEVESAPSNVATATTECPAPPPPELLEPTVAGVPVSWPATRADVGGRAFPGSLVTLFRDGTGVAALLLPAAEPLATAELTGFDYYTMSFDAAARRVAFDSYGASEGVSVLDLETGQRWTFTGDEPERGVLDAAGERLAFADWNDGWNLFLADLSDGSVEQITTDGQDYDATLFSGDGRSIFLTAEDPASGQSQVRHLDLATGVQTVLYGTYSSISHLAQSPDDRFLAVGFYYRGPELIDLVTGETDRLGNYENMRMSATPFSSDGRSLVFAQPGGNVDTARLQVVDLETRLEQDVSDGDGEFAAVFLDSRTLAFFERNPADSDFFSLKTRSLVDSQETILAADLDRLALPWGNGGPWDLLRTAGGALWLTQDEELQRRFQPSGYFVVPDVELMVGTNTFVARQELAGDTQESLPIEVIVDPDAFGDAEVLSMTAIPGLPVTGAVVAIEGIARNAGLAELEGLVASLVRVAPSGVSELVSTETFDLAAGETERVRFLWDTAGQEGDYRWRLVLDPADLLVELDETNNFGEVVVPVRDSLGAHATIATDHPGYFLSDVAAITSVVTVNDAPAPTLVTVTIEDPAGVWVAGVETWQDDAFGYDTRTSTGGWLVTGIYPGDYKAVVTVERSGAEAARAETPFTVSARIDAEVTGSADRPTYQRGDSANLLARLTNTGDATLLDSVLHLEVTTVSGLDAPLGSLVASIARPVAALPPGDLFPAPWALDLAPIPPGNYAFTARAVDAAGSELAQSTPIAFVVTAAGAELQGSLEVDPVSVEPGEGPLAVAAMVTNVGDAALGDVTIEVDVIDPHLAAVVGHLEAPAADFAAGQSRPFTWDLPLEVTDLQSYLLSLTAERPDGSGGTLLEPLATASFLLVDRTPPVLELLEPTTPIVCSGSMPVRVRAEDELSSVFRVFFHLGDSDNDLPLTRESVESQIFASQVAIDPDRTDPYHLEIFAEDTAGNASSGLPVDFLPAIDDEPPVLVVDGPADGTCVASAAFTWTADDLDLDYMLATLDGVSYAAGEPVAGDGDHLFELLAIDGCGSRASASRSFLLDATAPAIDVNGVTDGGVYEDSVTADWTIADDNLTATSAILDSSPVTAPVTVDELGVHVLELSATDCAGTTTVVSIVFEVVSTAVLSLEGGLDLPVEILAGEPLPVAGTALNLSTAQVVDSELSLRLVDPVTGDLLASHLVLVTLPTGGSLVIDHSFDTSGLGPGVYRVELRAAGDFSGDPYDLELARADVAILLFGLEGELDLPAEVLAGAPIPVAGTALNLSTGEVMDSELSLRLVDPTSGAVLASHLVVVTLPTGGSQEIAHGFGTAGLEPGVYRVELRATGTFVDPYDLELARSDVEVLLFGLAGAVDLPAEVLAGTPLEVTASVLNQSTGELADAELSLRLVDPVTGDVVTSHLIVASLPVDGSLEIGHGFDTAGLEPGVYRVELRAAGAFGGQPYDLELARSDAEVLAFDLVGILDLPAEVLAGRLLEVTASVENMSTGELVDAELALLLVDPATDAVLDSYLTVASLPTGGLEEIVHGFHTVDLEPRVYRVELRAAGAFAGQTYDMELTRMDFEVFGGVEIPTLGPGLLLLLAVLLAAAGTFLLRRGPASRGARATALWLAVGLLGAGAPTGAQAPAELCNGHFPILEKLAEAGSSALPVKSLAVERELAIEKALWDEELRHQRQVLARAGGEAEQRLDATGARARAGLDALAAGIHEKAVLSSAELSLLLRCGAEEGAVAASPISARLAEKALAEPAARRPSENRDRPDGYLEAPSDALIEATAAARRRRTGRQTRDASFLKVEIDRPDYLADKVLELAGDPVEIYNFVLQEIRASHYFGAIKGPEAVLRSGEGNDADQASLLAEMIRLAGFPARLAWGVQQVPIDPLLDHFQAPDAATLERVLTTAGIPWQPVISGGQPTAYLLDRVWAEVYLPYANYRGVVLDDSGATWLALDPQLKTLEPGAAGPRVLDEMGFDVEAFLGGYLAGDSCTDPLEQPGACPPPSVLIEQQVDAHLGAPGAYTEATEPVAMTEQRGEVLPPSMLGVVQGVDGFGIDLPAELQHRLRLRARDGSRVILDETVPASDLSGQEATLWYVPATADDEAIVDAYGGRLWNTPPYLFEVRLELRTGGVALVPASLPIAMGRPFELEITLVEPAGSSISWVNDQRAGVAAGLGVGAGAEAYAPPNGSPQNTLEVLAELASDYLASADAFSARLARLEGLTRVFPRPSVVTVGSIVEPQGSLGLIESLEWKSVFVDADVHGGRAVGSGAVADRDAAERWLRLSLLEASARERELFEVQGMAAMSADLALILAADRDILVHLVDLSNLGTILPTLDFEPAVTGEIEGWVLAGGEALVPAEVMSFVDWTGVGYVLIDPLTGDSRYQISGTLAGGMLAVPWFEVVDDVRTPLSHSHDGPVNRNGDEAVGGTIFDGNLQLATVGETLTDGDDYISFKLDVFDIKGVPVEGAEVSFTVLTGGGSTASGTVISDSTGLATVDFTLGTQTGESPYYLLFPDQDHATRAGLNVVAVEVNGHPVPDLFYAIGAPGEVAEVSQPYGETVEGLPHLSLGTPLLAVPEDEYGNPISNQDVVFSLSGGPGGDGKGPELISREAKLDCRPGTVIAGECDATTSVTDDGAVNGVWAWLVLGEDDSYTVTASATGEDGGSAQATFTGEVRKDRVPGEDFVGFPVLLVSGRGQPSGGQGVGSIEAYKPGEPSIPLQVNVHVVREDFGVEECGDDYCRVPQGTYTTIRLGENPAPECLPEECGGGTLDERVQIAFEGAGGGATISSPDGDGLYSYSVPMPDAPGRYEVTASPTAWVAVPKIPPGGWIDEVVPCTEDPLCGGKFEILEVSDPNWRSTYVLWAVVGEVMTPTPIVFLGHDGNHEEDTVFQYQIQPPEYPALNTYMFFVEDGTVPFLAQTDGTGDGTATLPQGEMFDHPEGDHEVLMGVNVGWVWSPRAGETVPLTVLSEPVPFSIALLDVDADSNNDDDIDEPQRDDVEEEIEDPEGDDEFGKFVYVNHDNDDGDGTHDGDQIPDYADREVANEDNLVPLMVELRPEGGSWGAAQLTFIYDGPPAGMEPDDTGTPLSTRSSMECGATSCTPQPHNYIDYDAKRGEHLLRLWRIENASDTKAANLYVVPNMPYDATFLGFGTDHEVIKLWVEGLNGTRAGGPLVNADVKVKLTFEGSEAEKQIRFTPVEADIAVNNSNGGSHSYLRAGVPDGSLWIVDEHDEKVEDQGDGYRFWYSETGDTQAVNMDNIDDMSPLYINIPAPLIEEDFDFTLQLVDPSSAVDIELYRVPLDTVGSTLPYLAFEDAATTLVGGFFGGGVLTYSNQIPVDDVLRAHRRLRLEPEDARTGYLFRVDPFGENTIREVQMNLLSKEKGETEWHTVDSIRMTFERLNHFFSLWSARGALARSDDYPTECHPQTACDDGDPPNTIPHLFYPEPHHVPGTGMPDPDKRVYFMPVHGYNVELAAAIKSFRTVTKRMYWIGFRGNVVAFTWEGDENSFLDYAGNVDNAFHSSRPFRELIEDKIIGEWHGRAENIDVMAHSLGNQVVYEALREHAVDSDGLLFRNLYSVEAAIWQEVFWPPNSYSWGPLGGSGGDDGIPYLFGDFATYTEDDLRCDSWAFWFNQEHHSTSESAMKLVHSYAWLDKALVAMSLDDYGHRNPTDHYTRQEGSSDCQRIPVSTQGPNGLSHDTPVLMSIRLSPYGLAQLFMPAGTTENVMTPHNFAATEYDWRFHAHSDFQDLGFPEIYSWYFFVPGQTQKNTERPNDEPF